MRRMSKLCTVLATVAALLHLQSVAATSTCAICTVVIALVEQKLQLAVPIAEREARLRSALQSACSTTGALQPVCAALLNQQFDRAVSHVAALTSPDVVCKNLNFCDGQCQLFKSWPVNPPSLSDYVPAGSVPVHLLTSRPATPEDFEQELTVAVRFGLTAMASWARSASRPALRATSSAGAEDTGFYATVQSSVRSLADPCGLDLKCQISRVFEQHLPFADVDNDAFANSGWLSEHLRGRNWRGTDCNDGDGAIYPGRRVPAKSNADVDHNCNSIKGKNSLSGMGLEQQFCNVSQRGIIILGDSATAHFHIPPAWLTARDMTWSSFNGILEKVEDELDVPQCSWSTGFQTNANCPPTTVPIKSVYQRLLERNRCNRGDFQNLGVNGARSTSMADSIMYSMRRDQQLDQPALVFYALIGNDVCNGHPGDGSFTPVDVFEQKVLTTLDYLDTKLPAGSHVVFIGLADGRVLWNSMHTRIHPIGVPYPDMYSFLSCTGSNPCWGWLNSDESWRNRTSEHAAKLSDVFTKVIAEQSGRYKNFKMVYQRPDWNTFISQYVAAGGQAHDLIEPVDGFHPSTTGQMLMAKFIWEYLEQNVPEALGPINPNNAAIDAMLGL